MSLRMALDQRKLGENNHHEHTWSESSFEEHFSQFYFQLVRTKDMSNLEERFSTLIETSKGNLDNLILLAKMTLNTRDCVGKGERDLTYMMLKVWYDYKPEIAFYIFETIMLNTELKEPLGSWKDIKYLCNYLLSATNNKEHPFIDYLINLTNYHLKQDWDTLVTKTDKNVTLLAKWIPREKSKKFGWLYELLVRNMFSRYYTTAKTDKARKSADRKARKEYRTICSTLNRYLDTTQIKQCNKNWRNIDPNTVTSITFSKQKMSLFNQKRVGGKIIERSDNEDRKECRENFVKYLNDKKEQGETIKGKRCCIYDFVKDALKYQHVEDNQLIKDTINSQWENNSKQNFNLNNMIALVDTSGSMESDNCLPLYNAIGLGIRISEKTSPAFRNRVLTFSAEPTWVNLDNCENFCDKVSTVRKAEWGMNTDIYKAFRLILAAIEDSKMRPEEVENLTLAILSDMQIDSSQERGYDSNTLYKNIKKMFQEKGIELYGRPFNPPNILFWNLRKTDGFPTQATEDNITMLSGYSPFLLNVLCEKGFEELKKTNSYDLLKNMLNNERYTSMEDLKNLLI